MKISTLLEDSFAFPEIKERRVRRLPKNYNLNLDSEGTVAKPRIMKRREHLGTGAFASTYSSNKNPFDVTKMSRRMTAPERGRGSDIDGFYYYLKALSDGEDFIEGDSTSNPYYPRFRNIRLYRKGDTMAYTVQVERLTDIDELREQETYALWRKLFGENSIFGGGGEAMAEKLTRLVRYGDGDEDDNIDKNLKRAVRFIRNVKSKHNIQVDIHPGNIMVRRTPYGPQLVLTDPLGFRNDYHFKTRTPQDD